MSTEFVTKEEFDAAIMHILREQALDRRRMTGFEDLINALLSILRRKFKTLRADIAELYNDTPEEREFCFNSSEREVLAEM